MEGERKSEKSMENIRRGRRERRPRCSYVRHVFSRSALVALHSDSSNFSIE